MDPSDLQLNGGDASSAAAAAAAAATDASEFDYNEAFPALQPTAPRAASAQGWATGSLRSSQATEIFSIPAEEQKSKSIDSSMGGKEVAKIQQETGTTITLSVSKDKSLTVVISGKRANIPDAKKRLLNVLQTQVDLIFFLWFCCVVLCCFLFMLLFCVFLCSCSCFYIDCFCVFFRSYLTHLISSKTP